MDVFLDYMIIMRFLWDPFEEIIFYHKKSQNIRTKKYYSLNERSLPV